MIDEVQNKSSELTVTPVKNDLIKRDTLDSQALELINQIITEKDSEKTKDLTNLFNQNQNKKTIIRINKLNDLLDVITEQAINRFTEHSDEITTKELLDGLKAVQDSVERGQKQVAGNQEQPLIQVNQQNNEIKLGDDSANLNKESRDRIKRAVLALLGQTKAPDDSNIIDVESINDNSEELK